MAITSSVSQAPVGGGDHTITLHVAFDPGGGPTNTAEVHVTIRWEPDVLENPSNESPAGSPTPITSPAGGIVTWQSAMVDAAGTDFQVQLSCKSSSSPVGTVVAGIAEEAGTTRSKTVSVGISCE